MEEKSRPANGSRGPVIANLHGGFDNRADEGPEAGVGMLYVQPVARAAQQHGKHARGMDQFHGGIHRKESHGFRARMPLFPAPHSRKREVLHFFIKTIER